MDKIKHDQQRIRTKKQTQHAKELIKQGLDDDEINNAIKDMHIAESGGDITVENGVIQAPLASGKRRAPKESIGAIVAKKRRLLYENLDQNQEDAKILEAHMHNLEEIYAEFKREYMQIGLKDLAKAGDAVGKDNLSNCVRRMGGLFKVLKEDIKNQSHRLDKMNNMGNYIREHHSGDPVVQKKTDSGANGDDALADELTTAKDIQTILATNNPIQYINTYNKGNLTHPVPPGIVVQTRRAEEVRPHEVSPLHNMRDIMQVQEKLLRVRRTFAQNCDVGTPLNAKQLAGKDAAMLGRRVATRRKALSYSMLISGRQGSNPIMEAASSTYENDRDKMGQFTRTENGIPVVDLRFHAMLKGVNNPFIENGANARSNSRRSKSKTKGQVAAEQHGKNMGPGILDGSHLERDQVKRLVQKISKMDAARKDKGSEMMGDANKIMGSNIGVEGMTLGKAGGAPTKKKAKARLPPKHNPLLRSARDSAPDSQYKSYETAVPVKGPDDW